MASSQVLTVADPPTSFARRAENPVSRPKLSARIRCNATELAGAAKRTANKAGTFAHTSCRGGEADMCVPRVLESLIEGGYATGDEV